VRAVGWSLGSAGEGVRPRRRTPGSNARQRRFQSSNFPNAGKRTLMKSNYSGCHFEVRCLHREISFKHCKISRSARNDSGLSKRQWDAWLRHFRAAPELAEATVRMLARKTRWTAAIAEALAQGDASIRLVRVLLLYVEQFGEAQGEGRYVLDWGLSQSDLATLLGVRREWLNQILSKWQKRKLLILEEGKLTILNLPHLLAERDVLTRKQ